MSADSIRVMIAAESADVRATLEAALSGPAHTLELVEGVEEAVARMAESRTDVVLLELGFDGDSPPGPEALLPQGGCERPVILIVPSHPENPAIEASLEPFADYLRSDELDPPLVRRVVHHAVDRARAERALANSEKRYRSLFEQARDAMFMTGREGEIVELNQAALDLLGGNPEALLGRDVREIYVDPSDRLRFQREIEEQGHIQDFEVRLRGHRGIERWCLLTAWVYRNPDGEVAGYQGIVHDIEKRKEAEDQLLHEAFHDPLTELPNRALFMDRLERSVARRRRGEEREMAVLFLDMDRFKVVNDSLGHLAGDELLRRMGRLLAEEIREEDTVSRIGGDEFAILLDRVDDPADATHVAERIQTRLRTPFRIGGQDVFASVSIGITFGGADVDRPEDLLRNADTAMYRAKELGPAGYQIYDEAMHVHAITLLQLETDLRLALEREEFTVHYQPLIDVAGNRIAGFEALVRWQHPQQGLLRPRSFIPVAEDTGLIVPLGAWVLRTALRQIREWHDEPGLDDLYVSVNLSNRQFGSPDLVDSVERILEEEGVPGSALRLEITESAMMRNPSDAIQVLQKLRALGIHLCIDDFGTGFSSLHTLHALPIDSLKIDRSFIARLGQDDEGQVVQTILTLARNLGLDAVAEGVETERQMDLLRSLRPGAVQGFLFASALEPGDAARTLREWATGPS